MCVFVCRHVCRAAYTCTFVCYLANKMHVCVYASKLACMSVRMHISVTLCMYVCLCADKYA